MSVDVAQCYRRHGPMVLRRCRVLLKDEELAVEAMHDVFVQLVRRASGRTIDAPSSFLYRSATNVCLNHLRAQRRRPADANQDLIDRIATAPVAEEHALTQSILNTLFRREPPSTRVMAVLYLVDGMTLDEVAAEVGLSRSGVRKRLRSLQARVPEVLGGAQ